MTRSTFYIDQVGHENNEDGDEKRVVKDLWNIFLVRYPNTQIS